MCTFFLRQGTNVAFDPDVPFQVPSGASGSTPKPTHHFIGKTITKPIKRITGDEIQSIATDDSDDVPRRKTRAHNRGSWGQSIDDAD